MRPDGTDLRQLTDGSSEEIFFDFELAWSPGGDRLAFVRQSPDGDRYGFQLWTIDSDGGSARMVYEGPDSLNSLSWAADDSLVVNRSRGGQRTVLRVAVDSGEASEVATGSWSPALSEAGTEVTYWDLDSLDAGDGLNLITTRLVDGARGVLPTASPFNPLWGCHSPRADEGRTRDEPPNKPPPGRSPCRIGRSYWRAPAAHDAGRGFICKASGLTFNACDQDTRGNSLCDHPWYERSTAIANSATSWDARAVML